MKTAAVLIVVRGGVAEYAKVGDVEVTLIDLDDIVVGGSLSVLSGETLQLACERGLEHGKEFTT